MSSTARPTTRQTQRTRSNAMAYNEFAYFYDEFNGEADYEANAEDAE